jgi:hypothetical protein
MNKSKKY